MWDKLLISLLGRLINEGQLSVTFANGVVHAFGKPARDGDNYQVSVTFHKADLPRKLIFNPELALGEAYMDEALTIEGDDVRGLMQLVIRNSERGHLPLTQRLARNARWFLRRWHQWTPLLKARQNVEHHYEIKSEFYYLFLDDDYLYTCAYFREDGETLEQAQTNKKLHIARKLLLKPGMRVLDIGCGWGGLAINLAKEYGVHVTGVTLSAQQRAACEARAAEAGVADLTDFRLQDYRHVDEVFDRIVSVGMLEHVGQPQYRAYFEQIDKNLAEDGVALIHHIGRTAPPSNLNQWFNKYIFPGGYSPSLSETIKVIEHTNLAPSDIEVWRTHYAKTVHEWLLRFEARLDEVRTHYDERFIRMWRFYLVSSELSMIDMPQVIFHMQLAKSQTTVPVTRDYLYP